MPLSEPLLWPYDWQNGTTLCKLSLLCRTATPICGKALNVTENHQTTSGSARNSASHLICGLESIKVLVETE